MPSAEIQIIAQVATRFTDQCLNLHRFSVLHYSNINFSYRWFHESSRWLVLNNKPEEAIKTLKSVAKFNGRGKEGEKIDEKVSERGVFVLSCLILQLCVKSVWFETNLSSCVDAARVHEERDVRFAGLLLCPGSVPHTHDEEHDSLPQCCLVRRKVSDTFQAPSLKAQWPNACLFF